MITRLGCIVGNQTELNLNEAEYVLLHAPLTIDESKLGIDTLDLLKKTITMLVSKNREADKEKE
jgi:hypothetical protein